MRWFSSDWHLGHARSIPLGSRPFSTVEEMDEAILGNALSVMSKGDHFYFIGDLAANRPAALKALKEIRKKGIFFHWVIGNHDVKLLNEELRSLSASCAFTKVIKREDNTKIHLSHFPLVVWEQSFRNSWHLFGHVHRGSVDLPIIERYMTTKCLNVNLEFHHYMPWSEEDIGDFMSTQKDNEDYVLLKKRREIVNE